MGIWDIESPVMTGGMCEGHPASISMHNSSITHRLTCLVMERAALKMMSIPHAYLGTEVGGGVSWPLESVGCIWFISEAARSLAVLKTTSVFVETELHAIRRERRSESPDRLHNMALSVEPSRA